MIVLTSKISICHLEQNLLVLLLETEETFGPNGTVAEDLLLIVVVADYYGLVDTVALSRLSDGDLRRRRNILSRDWSGRLCLSLRGRVVVVGTIRIDHDDISWDLD